MSSLVRNEKHLHAVGDRIRSAEKVTRDLIADLCVRLPVLRGTRKAAEANRLIEIGAWTEAALALVEIELPRWKLRRLVLESGEWFCSLSKQVNLPIGLDETADARHPVLPLAILGALVEARCQTTVLEKAGLVPAVAAPGQFALSCENYS